MASAIEVLRTYAGEMDEDPCEWIGTVNMTQKIFSFDNDTMKKILLLKLRGNAQIWASQLIQKEQHLQYGNLCKEFIDRFDNMGQKFARTENFLKLGHCKDAKDFENILREATYIVEIKQIKTSSIMRICISKAPKVLKSVLLNHYIKSPDDWQNFL
ncbi:hypothetical protein BDAP_001761 [Binucleata daphniae]